MLDYSDLVVADADGHALRARLAVADARALRPKVDDRGARYPLVIDPAAAEVVP